MPVLSMFLSMVVLGAWLALASSSWFGVWSGLELNLMSFIPIMVISGGSSSVEAGLKYFLVQACGSLVIFQSGVMLSNLNSIFLSVLSMALVLKMGGAPFHFWLPMIMEGLSWFKVALLASIQKIAPLCVMFYLVKAELNWLISSMSLISGVVGTVGGINEMFIRKLLAYSSISHLGWILLGILTGTSVWLVYFVIYCSILLGLVTLLSKAQVYFLNQMNQIKASFVSWVGMGTAFFSLGGLPPLVGFFGKWWTILSSAQSGSLSTAVSLSLLSIISLFYYLRLSLVIFINKLESSDYLNPQWSDTKASIVIFMNLSGSGLLGWAWSTSLLH